MTEREHFRDKALGTALRELEVPEHQPDFERELEALFARPRRNWRVPAGSALGVAVAAALVLLLIGLPSTGGQALAAQVKAKVAAALARATTLSGRIVERSYDASSRTVRTSRAFFAMTARGDLRLKSLDSPDDAVYDPVHGVERALGRSAAIAGGPVFASERTGIAPGPPDGGPSDLFLQRQLGSALRALLVSGGAPHAQRLTYHGRPAWRVDLAVRPSSAYPDYDRLELTIDRETGFPLLVRTTLHGDFRSELRVESLRVNQALPANVFELRFQPGREVLRSDDGFRRVSLAAAAARVGYPPLVPDALPRGYRLAEIAAARTSRAAPTATNPPSRGVVSLSYRRGFDQLIVTTRRRGSPSAHWNDPFAVTGLPSRSKPVRIDAGALKGATAEVVIDARSIPHLWAVTGKLVVTVSGDANEFELIQVVRSLHAASSLAAAAPCRAAGLRARTAGLIGATGSLLGTVGVENIGSAPCTVAGRPRVRILGAGRVLPVRQLAVPPDWGGQLVPKGFPRLLVGPGETVDVRLGWSNWCGGATGRLALVLDLPGGGGRLTVRLPRSTPRCDSRAAGSSVGVQPFMPEF